MLDTLCKQCNICWNLMPQPKSPPLLVLYSEEDKRPSPVLVVDDCPEIARYGECVDTALEWLHRPFDYTTTIRCDHRPQKVEDDALLQIAAKCAVWTHGISEGRKLILTTERGLRQLKIEKEHREGDVFRNARLGVIVVIPPLLDVHSRSEEFRSMKSKVERALKEIDA